MTRIRGWLIGLVLTVTSLLVWALIIDAVAFYILDIKYAGYAPERFFEYSPLTGHLHRPSAEGRWYRYYDSTKFAVRTNRHGFADSERALVKERPRIALIGDSVVEFWEAEEKDRGQYVIEDMLDGEYEVLTFGVRGFGTDQTWILFENTVVNFTPDIVVYTFTVNDIYDNVTTRFKPYFLADPANPDTIAVYGYPVEEQTPAAPGAIERYKRYSIVWRRLDFGLRLLRARLGRPVRAEHVSLEDHFELRPFKRKYNREDTRRMDITMSLIDALHDSAESRGMKFLVVEALYKPVLDPDMRRRITREYGDVFDFDKVSNLLSAYCEEQGIAFVSLPKLLATRKGSVSEYMHPDDTLHFNAQGIRFYSRAVVDKLHSLGWTRADRP